MMILERKSAVDYPMKKKKLELEEFQKMIPMFKNSTKNECGCGMSDNMGVSK